MAKFIEVHSEGERRLVNLDHVEEIRDEENGCCIYFAFDSGYVLGNQDWCRTEETYTEVRALIAKAQGGIPIAEKSNGV